MTMRLAFSIGVVVVAVGCFRPSIHSGGFTCAEGRVCPEGFECALIDNHCYAKDAGPDVACQPPPTPVCGDGPQGNDACSPACQTGCACGRCTIVGDRATCTPAGTRKLGEACNLTSDDCEAGLGCNPEPATCGANFGRCYRFCRDAADCDGQVCYAGPLGGSQKICALPAQDCDPVADTGCPSSALGCYWTSERKTYCDCRGIQDEGDTCGIYNDCIVGFTCVVEGAPPGTCRQLCTPGGGECFGGQTCRTNNSAYGYCL
jgi:hypothetical protein